MKPLKIESTKFTPKIHFDPENNIFLISGFSLPENVSEFYSPVLKWLDQFVNEVDKKKIDSVKFTFRLVYYNSGSFKVIINILLKLVNISKKSVHVNIDWYYDEDDNQLKDIGEELSDLVGLPFNYISK
jgi:hypothetical protein